MIKKIKIEVTTDKEKKIVEFIRPEKIKELIENEPFFKELTI